MGTFVFPIENTTSITLPLPGHGVMEILKSDGTKVICEEQYTSDSKYVTLTFNDPFTGEAVFVSGSTNDSGNSNSNISNGNLKSPFFHIIIKMYSITVKIENVVL